MRDKKNINQLPQNEITNDVNQSSQIAKTKNI